MNRGRTGCISTDVIAAHERSHWRGFARARYLLNDHIAIKSVAGNYVARGRCRAADQIVRASGDQSASSKIWMFCRACGINPDKTAFDDVVIGTQCHPRIAEGHAAEAVNDQAANGRATAGNNQTVNGATTGQLDPQNSIVT